MRLRVQRVVQCVEWRMWLQMANRWLCGQPHQHRTPQKFATIGFFQHELLPMAGWRSPYLLQLFPRLPRFPGKATLARKLLDLDWPDVDLRLDDGTQLCAPTLREPSIFFAAVDGEYEPQTGSVLKSWLAGGGHFLDIGANIGIFSCMVGRAANNVNVICMEANPNLLPYLESNLAANRVKNSQILNVLCGENDAESVDFYTAPAQSNGMSSRAPQFSAANKIQLTMRSLDLLFAQTPTWTGPVVLKVDVEGFEREVFLGARAFIAHYKPKIIFEFVDWAESRRDPALVGAAQQLLLDMGYRLWRVGDYLSGAAPLAEPLTHGGAMIVALPSDDVT
jgi:FkbM family methyltransferase